MLDYYARIADVMVPHLRNRPTTFRRYPNGVEGMSFFEKHAPDHQPEWIATIEVPSKQGEHEPIVYTAVGERPTLLWAANLAAIEFHVPLWHVAKGKPIPAPPDYMVFDLDPGPGTSIVECCRVARWLGERLDRDALFAKTSGSKGLQLYTRVQRTTWDQLGERAHDIARAIERDHPGEVVSTMRKSLR
ncbi:MAG: ATP-dependent DNA ligase, partial [Acidimicrobiales bacterium]